MDPLIKGVIIGAVSTATLTAIAYQLCQKKCQKKSSQNQETIQQKAISEPFYALLGDIGGTNVRFVLKKLDPSNRNLGVKVKEEFYEIKNMPSFEFAVNQFIQEYKGTDTYPQIAVIGIAGPVEENTTEITNAKHWKNVNGNEVADKLGIEQLQFLNDFKAAGHGLLNLNENDFVQINNAVPQEDGVKAVIGPGTGLGMGFLVKSSFSPYYEVQPSEGGHSEFAPRNEEEYAIVEFSKNFIATSDNIENKRAKAQIQRVSVERVGAGPAIPMLYKFYSERYPDLPKVLEDDEGKEFNDIKAKDIIEMGIQKNDALCMKVVKKFTEIVAVEAANLSLKTLPFGGLYLIGGVTEGIKSYILQTDTFADNFFQKGRLEPLVRKIPVYVVNESAQVGLQGAEEYAYRLKMHQD